MAKDSGVLTRIFNEAGKSSPKGEKGLERADSGRRPLPPVRALGTAGTDARVGPAQAPEVWA